MTRRSSRRRRRQRASRSTTASPRRATPRRDGAIEQAGRALLAAGADRLPALRVGRALYCGERRVAGALTAARVARVAQG